MLTGIEIRGLRGLHEATLDGFTPLTIVVGPSGAGKSTLLDAILVATSSSPGDAVGRVVLRRKELPAGGPWLFERAPEVPSAKATIRVRGDAVLERTATLWRAPAPEPSRGRTTIQVDVDSNLLGTFRSWTILNADNSYEFGLNGLDKEELQQQTPPTRLVEVAAGANHESLSGVYSRVARGGGLALIRETTAALIPGARDLRLLTYDDGQTDRPTLHVEMMDYTVPIAAMGSGIYAALRLALELAGQPQGIALVEEPEIHQHPSVMTHTAKLLLHAVGRGLQVVVTTHSEDLIDAIVADARDSKEDMERLSVIRVSVNGGVLKSSHFTGPMALLARETMGEDLR